MSDRKTQMLTAMGGVWVKGQTETIVSKPTSKALVPGFGLVASNNISEVYKRWCEQNGQEPQEFNQVVEKPVFNKLFEN
jgi:hypothetical protein